MGRPLLAVGLIAVAALLLGSLFSELEDGIRDPEAFSPDAQMIEKAAQTAAQHPEYLEAAADAGALELAAETPLTIPPGAAEIDGETIRLLEDIQWTLPAGTEIDDLTLPLPPGTELTLPSGTRIDGDTLVFPPDSAIVLADGTTLELPEGGRLRIPGADTGTLRSHIEDGVFTVPAAGGIFTAPQVHNLDDWPMTLPEGTAFQLPDGFELPEGIWHEGGTITLPEGHRVEPRDTTGGTEIEPSEGLFEKIGQLDLTPPEPKEAGESGESNGPGFALPGGTLWYWLLGLMAAAVAGVLLWRHRSRLAGLLAAPPRAPLAAAAPRHPFRIIAAVDPHPEHLPLALAPDRSRLVQLRLEAVHTDKETGDEAWRAAAADCTVRIGPTVLYEGPVTASGIGFTVPPLPSGDHSLHLDVRLPGHRPATLVETLRVAPWSEQVARDYDRLAKAIHTRTRLPPGFTPRVLEVHALPVLPAAAHQRLSAALAVFERANYSQGTIDEDEWMKMVQTVEAIIATFTRAPTPHALRADGHAATRPGTT